MSGSEATKRWAAFFAFSVESPASAVTRRNLAPPIDVMPPPLLMSSIAIWAPFNIKSPWRAQGPDSGAISPTFTSFAWARMDGAETANPSAANAAATIRITAPCRICRIINPPCHDSYADKSSNLPPHRLTFPGRPALPVRPGSTCHALLRGRLAPIRAHSPDRTIRALRRPVARPAVS